MTESTTSQEQQRIQAAITGMFAQEDEGLRFALQSMRQEGLPEIQISPIQGKFLQLLVAACSARKILEIGSLGGYSGIWLARALPEHGHLITLEINPKHAEVVRRSFEHAGVAKRTEVRVGNALDLLPQLTNEAPFDLVFIDADKPPYPHYLEWALKLTRPGSIIVADNTIKQGRGLQSLPNAGSAENQDYDKGIIEYNRRIASNPRLVSLALAMDDNFTDGFSISVVKS
ncbi:MAG TPA: O-methyltransferase [Ktedonobacteraceae bacterium]|jgi:caffeoyl-CoA O-methyltransferase|nr:O-methyltransferase [Ktedonobacteraceae bacterium]